MTSYEFESVVRGFHEYQSIWTPEIGEELVCKWERHNAHDPFAVAVMKSEAGVVVGHLPRKLARVTNHLRACSGVRSYSKCTRRSTMS